ncbi:MAG TPA: POTRA domain-containing protein [Bryobacteraceae bacterium]|jgi:outer membrane protein assembly factor BamA|nr:POTRA domain-containing protein [Bryobacteraceae bacterium]
MPRILFVLLLLVSFVQAQNAGRKAAPAGPNPVAGPPLTPNGPPLTPNSVARDFPLDSITIEGNRILSTAGIIAASGLKKGATGNIAVFDAARDRLIASGYFDLVSYHYKPATAGGYDVTFDVQEIDTLYPVRIDGLPATLDDVIPFLKSKDPLFTGQMPGTQQVIRRTANEIEQYLESKGHADKVAGEMITAFSNDNRPGHFEVDFTPARGLPVVSAVSFEGSKVISAIDLHNKISEVAFGQPFTEDGVRALLEGQIVPLYEAKGYMRVTFPKITSQPSTEVTGVDVKVAVDEGVEYKATRVVATGGSAAENERVLKAAKIPQEMTVANFDQIRDAAKRGQDSMRHQGFLDARVTADKKIDDVKKTVQFLLVVNAGPEYKFGKLTVNGLGLDGEAAIRKMWSVKTGDPFPEGYGDYFLSKVKEEGLFDNLGDTKAKQDINADTHVVDTTLDFKGSPPKEKAPRRPGEFGGR